MTISHVYRPRKNISSTGAAHRSRPSLPGIDIVYADKRRGGENQYLGIARGRAHGETPAD